MTLPTSVQISLASNRVTQAATLGTPDLQPFQAEIDYFRRNIGNVQSDAQLLADRRLFDFAMDAFDLPNDRNARGFIRTLLTENPTDPNARVNQLDNPRYREFATLFQFPGTGVEAVKSQTVVDGLVQRFTEVKTADARLEAVVDPVESRGLTNAQRRREIEYFLENIGNVKTAEDLTSDFRLYNFAITAFDLQGQENAQGLIQKLISEDFSDPESLFNRLQNIQFREFATFFELPGAGERNLLDKRSLMTVVDRYVAVTTEITEGEANPGVRLALYFERNAGDVQSYFGLLADRPLREFIFTAFSLPQELNQLPAERLADRLEELFDLNELQSAEGRDRLVRRFSAVYDLQNGPGGGVNSPILDLFQPVGVASAASLFAAAVLA